MYSYSLVGRAIAMDKTNGFVKLLVSNDDYMKILGIRAAGPQAGSIIEIVSLMIHLGRPVKDLVELRTSYPTISEGLIECARILMKSSIFKPEVFKTEMRFNNVNYDTDGNPIIRF